MTVLALSDARFGEQKEAAISYVVGSMLVSPMGDWVLAFWRGRGSAKTFHKSVIVFPFGEIELDDSGSNGHRHRELDAVSRWGIVSWLMFPVSLCARYMCNCAVDWDCLEKS